MTIHGALFTDFKEKESADPFSLQNKKLLRVDMRYGEVLARIGSMVAYQGDVRFAKRSTGMSRMFKSAVSGEGVSIMTCSGSGELFLADDASEIQIIYLDNDMVSVNGANVLAFSASIEWDIHRISTSGAMTGGLYNVSLRGTGYVAVTTNGDPIALDVASAPTYADAQAVVLWTSGVSMQVKVDTGGIGSMIRGGTGELLQMAFGGQGYVLVQPAENVPHGGSQSSSTGGMLGGLLS